MPQRPPYPTPPRHSRHGSEDNNYYYGAAGDERPRRRRDYDEQQRRGRDEYSSRNYDYDYDYDYYRGGSGDEERYYQSRRSQRDRYAPPPDYYTMQPPPPPPSSSSHRDAHRDRYNYEERGHYDYYERRGSRDARTTSGPAPVYYQEDYEPTRQAEATSGSHRAPPLAEYYNTPPPQSSVVGPAATMMPYATSGSIFAAPDAMAGQPAPVLQQQQQVQQPEVCGSGMSTSEGQDLRVVVGRVAPTSTTTTMQANAPTVSQQPAAMAQPVGNTPSSEKSARLARRPAETPVLRPGATHLVVPTTLPIQVSSLLDLLAFYVVQGGPTTEEEIYRREEHNPHFAFLNAKWNDPRLIYYRWRLYSLLQGDTMTSWRIAPFQIEAGAKAHIWQPPPLPQAGPDVLLQAFTAPQLETTAQHKRARDNDEKKTEEDTEKKEEAYYPPPSALWLGHQVVGEGKMFVTLSEDDVAEWTTLLDVEATLQEGIITNSEDNETTTSAQTDYAVLLSREVIARRMVFAIEHSSAAVHVLSLVLDAVLRVTYDCARQLQATQQHPNVSQTLSEEVIAQLERACYALLGYLFLLHDIARNAPFKPVVCTEAELEQMYTEYQLTGTVPEELTGKAHSHLLSRSAPALHAAMEMIMPTLLEACTLTAMTILHITHHLQRQRNNKEEAEGEGEFVVSCRISHDATRASSTVVPKEQRVATKAFLLLHWMKELFVLWSPASVQDTLGGESHASNDAEGVTASLVRGEASVEDLLKSKLSPQEILRAAAAAELADRQKKISSSAGGSTGASDIRPAALLQLSKRGEQRRRRRVRTAVLSGRVSTILAERYGFLLAGDEATEAS